MKKLLLSLAAALCGISGFAQIDNGVTPATGRGGAAGAMLRNWEAIGINPANLGWKENYLFSVGVFNFGISAQSKALDIETLRGALMNPEDTFTTAEKQKYAAAFSTPDGLNLQSQVTWGAVSFATPKLGGIAVNLRDRTFAHVGLNRNAADILFNGKNAQVFQDTATYSKTIGELLDSTHLSYLHYRELNIAYGRRLLAFGADGENGEKNVQLYGGFGLKLLWGMGSLDLKAENKQYGGHAALSSNLGVNTDSLKNFTPENSEALFDAAGNGMAFDFGVSMAIKQKLRIGIAVTDVGSIKWKNNQLISTDTVMTPPDTSNNGINSWNLGAQENFFDPGVFNYENGPDFTTKLPTRLRLGAALVTERIEFGADMVMPLNDESFNLGAPYFGLGMEYNFLGYVKASVGMSGGAGYGLSVPVGLQVGIGGVVETGAAIGDVLSLFSKSDNPNLSASFFILRVNIKKKKPSETAMPTI